MGRGRGKEGVGSPNGFSQFRKVEGGGGGLAQAEGLRVESKNGYRNRAGELKEFAMRWEMPGGTAARRGEVVESSKRKEGGSQSVYAQLRPVVAGQGGGLQNMTQGACVCVLFTNVKQKKKKKERGKKTVA